MTEHVTDDDLKTMWQTVHAGRAAKSRSDCLTEGQFMRLAQGDASTSERKAAADHLSVCTACAQEFRLIRALRPWAREAAAHLDPEAAATKAPASFQVRKMIWSVSLAAAAVLVVAIGATVYINRDRLTAVPPTEETRVVAPPAALPAVAPRRALRLEKPPLKLTAAVALRWRGAPEEGSLATADLARALEAYQRDDFADAAGRLDALTRRAPRLAEAHFYLGVSKLFVGEPAAALGPLEQARSLARDIFSLDASWYLALAHDAIGDRERALGELRPLCDGQKEYAAQACQAIRELSSSR